MFPVIHEFATYSIAFAVIIGWVYLKRITPEYFPFLCILTIGLCNEFLSTVLIETGNANAINTNIYCLLESIFIAWQLKRWGLFRKAPSRFYGLIGLYLLIWISESIYSWGITRFYSYFIAIYSFSTVLLSISFINSLTGPEKSSLLKNPAFIICIGFVIYYTYAVLIEIFYLYGLQSGGGFASNIFRMHTYINLLGNLIYAIAFLWIPRKREFIQL